MWEYQKPIFVNVNCNRNGYERELWCQKQRKYMKLAYDLDISYDYNGSLIHWIFPEDRKKEADEMTTVWMLEEQGYRCSYQKHVKTFFWVDSKFYKENKREILSWAKQHKCEVPSHEYGWITCPSNNVVLMFMLTWAGKTYGIEQ